MSTRKQRAGGYIRSRWRHVQQSPCNYKTPGPTRTVEIRTVIGWQLWHGRRLHRAYFHVELVLAELDDLCFDDNPPRLFDFCIVREHANGDRREVNLQGYSTVLPAH